MTSTNAPAAHLKTVRRLARELAACIRREERCDDLAQAWKLAAASDRAAARLRDAQNGITREPPRTRRNLARGAFAALATIGKAIGRALVRAESLRRARIGAAIWRAARKARKAARRALSAIVAAVMPKLASKPATRTPAAPVSTPVDAPIVALTGRRALVAVAVVLAVCPELALEIGGVS